MIADIVANQQVVESTQKKSDFNSWAKVRTPN